MPNPYRGRPAHTFWRQAVSEPDWLAVDPAAGLPFRLAPQDAVASAGSCFAQHISRALAAEGFNVLMTERFTGAPGTRDENYGVFPARFGNLYTARQLRQLFLRAYGLLRPRQRAWRLADGSGWLDPCRPRIQAQGFASAELLEEDRTRHLAAVRSMFEACAVFIFTLGLTEGWVSSADGIAVPLAPGVVGVTEGAEDWHFHNASFAETLADMQAFLADLRSVNPGVRVLFTVSPVPLVATYEDRHVLVSTTASKAILRAVVDELCRQDPGIAYFPSYEIITGPHTAGRFYAADRREVTPEGVAHVMGLFARHALDRQAAPAMAAPAATPAAPPLPPAPAAAAPLPAEEAARYAALRQVVCDEEAIVQPTGS